MSQTVVSSLFFILTSTLSSSSFFPSFAKWLPWGPWGLNYTQSLFYPLLCRFSAHIWSLLGQPVRLHPLLPVDRETPASQRWDWRRRVLQGQATHRTQDRNSGCPRKWSFNRGDWSNFADIGGAISPSIRTETFKFAFSPLSSYVLQVRQSILLLIFLLFPYESFLGKSNLGTSHKHLTET